MDEAEAMLGPTSENTVSQAMTHMTACAFFMQVSLLAQICKHAERRAGMCTNYATLL